MNKYLKQFIKDIKELQKVCVADMKDEDVRKSKITTAFFEGHLCACEDLLYRLKSRCKK